MLQTFYCKTLEKITNDVFLSQDEKIETIKGTGAPVWLRIIHLHPCISWDRLTYNLEYLILFWWKGPVCHVFNRKFSQKWSLFIKRVFGGLSPRRTVLTPAPRRVLWEDANATRNVWGPSALCWPGLHILTVTPTSTDWDKTPAFPAGWQLDRTEEGGERGRRLKEISQNILWAYISVENQHRCQPFFTPRPNVRLFFCFFPSHDSLAQILFQSQRLIKSPTLAQQVPSVQPRPCSQPSVSCRHNGAHGGFSHLLTPSEPFIWTRLLSLDHVYVAGILFDCVQMPTFVHAQGDAPERANENHAFLSLSLFYMRIHSKLNTYSVFFFQWEQ